MNQEKGLQADNGNNTKEKRRIYAKEATITIDVTEVQNGGAEDIIKAISENVGVGKILVVRPKQHGLYEVTLDKEDICHELVNGVEIKGKMCEIKKTTEQGVRGLLYAFARLPRGRGYSGEATGLESNPYLSNKEKVLSGN